jgi:hypothetical protein
MFTNHPEIVIAPESSFLTWLEPHFADWTEADCDSARLSEFVSALAAARKFETWAIASDTVADRIKTDRPKDYSELAAIPYRLYLEKIGKPDAVWGDKNNVHIKHIPELRRLYGESGFIHIVRDVRDCFASASEIAESKFDSPYKPMLEQDPREFGSQWQDENLKVLSDLKTGSNAWHTIRYEDLTTNPRACLEPALAKLGYGWDERMLDFHETNREKAIEPDATMAWKTLTTRPVTSSRIGRFRDVLSEQEIITLESSANQALTDFGYLP